jgi:hypothetical protein
METQAHKPYPSDDERPFVGNNGYRPTLAAALGMPIDLDALARWLSAPTPEAIDCVLFLNAWNLFAEVASATGATIEPDRDANLGVYDKLFWGRNIEPMTPPGEHYEPAWDDEEVTQLADVLGHGLRLVRHIADPQA